MSHKRDGRNTARLLAQLFRTVQQLADRGVDQNLILAVVFLALADADIDVNDLQDLLEG